MRCFCRTLQIATTAAGLLILGETANRAAAQTALLPTQMTPSEATQAGDPYRTQSWIPNQEPLVDAHVYYDGQQVIVDGGEIRPLPAIDPQCCEGPWTWQLLPDGLIYRSYLAGVTEPRMAGRFFYEVDGDTLLDATLGGRVALWRYGTTNSAAPEGWELDVEGAAFPRLDLHRNWDLVSVDFRVGVPLTYGQGKWRYKFGYYHLSSHLGDEQIIFLGSAASRINYSRDNLVLAASYFLNPSLRIYAEAAWAFYLKGGAKPWEFQFGMEYSPIEPSTIWGAPFFAVNGHLRQENNYGGNIVGQAGWQWRGASGHLFRVGVHYLNGNSNQRQFFLTSEQQIGLGVWYDY